MNGEKIIKLAEPVTVGSKTVTELRIRPLKAKHLRGIKIGYDGIEMDALLDLASKITGELPTVIDELSPEDLKALGVAVSDFLPFGAIMGGKQPSAT
ncbi:hypothetical protein SDC9_190427 [bioreactor metagenome]|uniref:Phage tail protein E n=1 Tax=bioreactor metagenome TaxID=1076179 RepID=A0A645HXF0_9ZZZZ|nr:phage tail assembly protein [Synergistaceae bacterium]